MDVDTRAYFTAATRDIQLIKSLSVYTQSQFLLGPCLVLSNVPCIIEGGQGPGSMYKKGKQTISERNTISINKYMKSIIIGCLLSDGWFQKNGNWNPRFGIKQSIKNFGFLWHLFFKVASLCPSFPRIVFGKIRGKVHAGQEFQTRQLVSLMPLYDLFFFQDKIKRISWDLYFSLDPIVQAYWIMGDGYKHNKGQILCTNSFTLDEVRLQCLMLNLKFNIATTFRQTNSNSLPGSITSKNKVAQIYINGKDMAKLRPLQMPHFPNCMLYKIGQ